jgi:YfiR/HmsC-like
VSFAPAAPDVRLRRRSPAVNPSNSCCAPRARRRPLAQARRDFQSKAALVAACVIFCGAAVGFAETVAEYQLKAEFIERFTRFIDWPPSSGPSGAFVIGVLGDDPFGPFLEQLAAMRKIKGKRVELRRLPTIESVDGCSVVFISSSEKHNIHRIVARTAGQPILTVGDSNGYAAAGVIVNFFTEGDKIRFEINDTAAGKSGLKVNAKLLKLARVVEGTE